MYYIDINQKLNKLIIKNVKQKTDMSIFFKR